MDIYILLDIVCSRISATTNIWVFLLGTFWRFLKKKFLRNRFRSKSVTIGCYIK